MNSRWFWRSWLADFRWTWYLAVCVFVVTFCFFWFTYFQGSSGVIHWNKFQEQKVLESTIHSFHMGPFEFTVPAENYVIIEYFNGSHIEMNVTSSLIFISILILCVVMMLSIITTLEKFWYFGGMTLFILFVVSLRLEVLSIAGQRNQIPAIVILLVYTTLSFYFKSLNPSVSFVKRLLSFFLLTISTAIIIHFFSEVQDPMLHLSVTGYTGAFILSVLFILMVAHEIPAAFVYVASQGNAKSLRHFIIISAVYILNIIITGLHELNVIHWNFIYTNIYLLLSISAILGLWGFRLRENLYQNIFSFSPFGAYFFVALGTLCFITIAQFFATSNDPALQIVRSIIIVSHIGYGVIFILYVFSNFILMLAQNLPVNKVLYKPSRMPYFTFRFAGLIATLGFVFYSGWHQYIYNGVAGFYNNIADLYEVIGRSSIAEEYYEQSQTYGFANNHANYELGIFKSERYSFDEAHENYEWANDRYPTLYSLINDGNVYLWENAFSDALNAYQFAAKKIPDSGELENNIGFTHGKMHDLDSAAFFLNEARKHENSKSSAEANFMAFTALEFVPVNCDSVLAIFNNPYTATVSNALASSTVQHTDFNTKVDALPDKKLNLYSASLLSNYLIRNAKSLDTVFIRKAYATIADSLNSDYSEALKASIAFAYYHTGNVKRALEIMGELAYISQSHKGKYNYIMGLWTLEQQNPALAARCFDYAVEANYKEGKLYKAIALSEAGKINEALLAWDTVSGNNEAEKRMASSMKKILTIDLLKAMALPDPEKYQFCRYRLTVRDTVSFEKIVPTFQDDNYKAQALLDMTKKQFEWGNSRKAILYFNQTGGLRLTSKILYEDIQHTELRMLAERKELRSLAKQINKGITFEQERKLEKIYYTALLNEMAGDTIHATINYQILATYNPYFEEGVISAAAYFHAHGKDRMKSYTILVEAIQVNNTSRKLLMAYASEAKRVGFDEYAESALQSAKDLTGR